MMSISIRHIFSFLALAFLSLPSYADVSVHAKAILKGAYDTNTSLMRDDLRVQNLIPLQQPYSSYGFNLSDSSTSTSPGVLAVTGQNAIVDWVVVELRTGSNAYSVAGTKAALLQRDGDIVDVDGVSPVTFNVAQGDYRVVIYFKNHIPIMSLHALDGFDGSVEFDSTNMGVQIFADDTYSGATQINGLRAMRPGDVNFDRTIKYTGDNNDRDSIGTMVKE